MLSMRSSDGLAGYGSCRLLSHLRLTQRTRRCFTSTIDVNKPGFALASSMIPAGGFSFGLVSIMCTSWSPLAPASTNSRQLVSTLAYFLLSWYCLDFTRVVNGVANLGMLSMSSVTLPNTSGRFMTFSTVVKTTLSNSDGTGSSALLVVLRTSSNSLVKATFTWIGLSAFAWRLKAWPVVGRVKGVFSTGVGYALDTIWFAAMWKVLWPLLSLPINVAAIVQRASG